ncbi:MAG: TrkA family potassium uptake protein [Eubacterium sp.]|nr:TrkA family potassium uptake protein [Eubacterium sp.]
MTEKNYAVLGLGRFGMKVADTIAATGAAILVADSDQELIDEVGSRFTSAVSLDMTNADALEDIGLEHIDVLIIDQAGHLQSSVMCTMVASDTGVGRIIATAVDNRSGEILKKLGADEIIIPEEESALRLAKSLISEDFLEFTDLGEGLCIVKIHVSSEWSGKSIRKLALREKHNINVIAVPGEDGGLTTEFSPDRVLNNGEIVILAMQKEELYQFV